MTLLEAISERHSVRRYLDKPLPSDVVKVLEDKITELNAQSGLHIQLVTDEPKAFAHARGYGKFVGISSYYVMAGPKCDELDERVGYYGEQLVLLAQTLGLNTCWAGVTFDKIPGTYELADGEKIACYIALGYGETQGHPHKSKSVAEVSNAGAETPEWFLAGVEAALLAPTAVNQQKFRLDYLDPAEGSPLPLVSLKRGVSIVGFTQMDLGIVRYHFELAAAPASFLWA